MVSGRGLVLLILAFVISACNLARPQVTPTVAPTSEATNSEWPTATLTPLIGITPSATPSPRPTPSHTPQPTSASTSWPTSPALPTLNPTELADLLQPPARTVSPTHTAIPATPTYITATAADDQRPLHTPSPSTPAAQLGGATSTPSPSPTRFQPTVAVDPDLLLTPIAPPVINPVRFSAIGASVYQYDVGPGQIFPYENLQLGGGVALFAPNPAAADSFVRTNQQGILLYRAIGSPSERAMTSSPFFEGFAVASSDENKNRITEIDWSADGQRFSFRIDPPPGLDNGNAGVWFWQPENRTSTDPTYQIIRDCAAPDYAPCRFVRPSNAHFWKTIAVEWSPRIGSYQALLTVYLPQEGRHALAMTEARRDAAYANQAPPFVRYDYGHWDDQGEDIIVSGRRPDGRVIIGVVTSGLSDEKVVFDASAAGLWVQDAVHRPDGGFAALGGPFADGPLALYDGTGRALSPPIGEAAPEAVRWYPDRSAVVVTVQGRQYTVRVDEGLAIDTTDLAGSPSFGRDPRGFSLIPNAVVQGSEYFAGQQLRVAVASLNIRQRPSAASQIAGELREGDYAAVLAGPYADESYRWWKVQTARHVIGWIAGRIGGRLTVRPA